ncbi:hypothetical protein WAI453_004054 [Rhynchosporium graminicola]
MPFRGEGYWFHKRESRCVWKRTLLVLKDTLQLTKFELLVQGDDMLRIYDNEWYEISGRENADAKQLEKLVLGIQGETWVSSRDHIARCCPLDGIATLPGGAVNYMTNWLPHGP